jgi:ATP-dependent protease ClpP protease subunit
MNKLMKLYADNRAQIGNNTKLVRNEGGGASLYIYDVIDAYWGVSAAAVIEALTKAEGAEVLDVYINSPGGSVFEGRAIMAALSRFSGKTVAHVDSLCASAATSIALACNEVVMSEGALFMIHNASSGVWGDKTDLRETADLLEKIEMSIIKDYTDKTGKDDAQVIAWMDAESWFTASEALANGFVDRIEGGKAKNQWNLSAYAKAPPQEPANETPPEPALPAGFFMSDANANRLRLSLI